MSACAAINWRTKPYLKVSIGPKIGEQVSRSVEPETSAHTRLCCGIVALEPGQLQRFIGRHM
jgi:hypothetical protein